MKAPVIAPLDGVSAVRVGPGALRFEVSGPIGPLITALGAHRVLSLSSRAPSLEEIFLHHYSEQDGGDGPPDGSDGVSTEDGADRGNRAGAGR